MSEYRDHHYVPIWYQKRFLSEKNRGNRYFYLDLHPEVVSNHGHVYTRRSLLKWGPSNCFSQNDLYTTKFHGWESTEIESRFFGKIDDFAPSAINFIEQFQYKGFSDKDFYNLFLYLTTQKIRTPKGLSQFQKLVDLKDRNDVLIEMQRLQNLFSAIWSECVWCIADASNSDTKFIVSDHPVTVYNKGCPPNMRFCKGDKDPHIWLNGTHTILPLSLNKILIFTNLSWLRNPYSNPLERRPHPVLLRDAAPFNWTNIQTQRMLSEEEVIEINYVIKSRAKRYIAAANKEWLYPEDTLGEKRWENLGNGYLFMPEPRIVQYSTETGIGYSKGYSEAFDPYGRKKGHREYGKEKEDDIEWASFQLHQCEFARVFGPNHRAKNMTMLELSKDDGPEYHQHLLDSEERYREQLGYR